MRNILTMLPNTPLADPEYIKKHSIKTSFAGSMENEENDTVGISNSILNKHKTRNRIRTKTKPIMGKQNLLHTTQPTQTPKTNQRNNKTNKPNLNFRSGGLERTEVGIIHTTSKVSPSMG